MSTLSDAIPIIKDACYGWAMICAMWAGMILVRLIMSAIQRRRAKDKH